jgi:membrane carboxypeptidase/penicillin-binding protein PbpC
LLVQVGAENVWRTVHQMGFHSLSREAVSGYIDRAPLLSGGEVTLLEAARGFGVFANQGTTVGMLAHADSEQDVPAITAPELEPVTILKVTDVAGRTWLDCSISLVCFIQKRPLVNQQLAYLITHILSDETSRWPSLGHPNPLEVGRPAAAKLGLTGGEDGSWTVGYTPKLVAGVWIGPTARDSNSILNREQEQTLSMGTAGLWHAIIQYASLDTPVEDWPMPSGLVSLEVCDPSGMLPTTDCPTIVSEIFMEGTEPSHPDTLFKTFLINRETGRLATVFTAHNLVEEKVFLIAPPEAQEWVEQAGLPIPPDAYDVVSATRSVSPSVRITSPEMFSHVKGDLLVYGRAAGQEFSFYRLQVGKGLNPREWIQVGSDNIKPVEDGLLGIWDTEGLSGLYAVRLMVVHRDQRVETAIVQITVDNTPPMVTITQPKDGERFSLENGQTIVFKVQAEDDTALSGVEFYLDDTFLALVVNHPYHLAWKGSSGSHQLTITATDLAGNKEETSVEFFLEK